IALTHWHWDHSFGSAAIDAPVIAHADTAAELAVQAAYDWSDEALDQRVRDGREIAFCAEFLRVELPDRSDLEIVLPSDTFTGPPPGRRGRRRGAHRPRGGRPGRRLVRCPRAGRRRALPRRLPLPAPVRAGADAARRRRAGAGRSGRAVPGRRRGGGAQRRDRR